MTILSLRSTTPEDLLRHVSDGVTYDEEMIEAAVECSSDLFFVMVRRYADFLSFTVSKCSLFENYLFIQDVDTLHVLKDIETVIDFSFELERTFTDGKLSEDMIWSKVPEEEKDSPLRPVILFLAEAMEKIGGTSISRITAYAVEKGLIPAADRT